MRLNPLSAAVLGAALLAGPALAQTPQWPSVNPWLGVERTPVRPPRIALDPWLVREKLDAVESRVDRLGPSARSDADTELRAIRAELYAVKRQGPVAYAELGSVNRRLDEVIARYHLYPLPEEV